MCTTTGLKCESDGHGREATDALVLSPRVHFDWSTVTMRLQHPSQLPLPGLDRLTSGADCVAELALRCLARVSAHGNLHWLCTRVVVSLAPVVG